MDLLLPVDPLYCAICLTLQSRHPSWQLLTARRETGENWVKELETDVKAECESKYGKVLHIHVEEQSRGEIYVKFDCKIFYFMSLTSSRLSW